jgi:hypothetical protein
MYPDSEERSEMTAEENAKIDNMAAAVGRMESSIVELTTVLRGYNGYKGIAQITQDHAAALQEHDSLIQEHNDAINSLRACVEPTITDIQTDITTLKNKSGNTALKWLNRLGVAALGAACLVFLTLWINNLTLAKTNVPHHSASETSSMNDP